MRPFIVFVTLLAGLSLTQGKHIFYEKSSFMYFEEIQVFDAVLTELEIVWTLRQAGLV